MMKKSVKIVLSVFGVIIFALAIGMIVAWSGVLGKDLDNSNLAFRILQLTDVHLRGDSRNNKVYDTMDKVISESDPDFIIVTGDVSSNRNNARDFKDFAEYIEKFKIEWTFTFGNHDSEGDWDKPAISAFLQKQKYCTYEDGFVIEENGVDKITQGSYGNYFRNVTNEDGNVIMSLFMMDSNMYVLDKERGYDGYACFRDGQIDWYEESVKKIAAEETGDKNKSVPSLAFFHIPMQEFNAAYDHGQKLDGVKFEDVCCSPKPDGMFEKMVELGSTKACFVGHDHRNSYTSEYRGIKLNYGYSADHTIYVVPQTGGKIINVRNDGSFSIQGIFRNLGVGKTIVTKAY